MNGKPHDWCQLLSDVLDEQPTAEQSLRLAQLLDAQPEALDAYLDLVQIHTMLYWRYAPAPRAAAPPVAVVDPNHNSRNSPSSPSSPGRKPCGSEGTERAAGLPPRASGPVVGPTVLARLIKHINTPLVYSMITAASVLFAGLTLLRILEVSWPAREVAQPASEAPRQIVAARLEAAVGCRWGEEMSSLARGDVLFEGKQLVLEAGLAEIVFRNGSRVLLEGPAALTIDRRDAVTLDIGALTAHVPAPAHGFEVHTPSCKIVDLGTEFGVRVDAEGAEVHVFGGAVRVEDGYQSQQFGEGQACFVAATNLQHAATGQFTPIAYLPERFVRRRPQASAGGSEDAYAQAVLASEPVAYWRLNELTTGSNPSNTAVDETAGGYDQTLGAGDRLRRTGTGNAVGPRPNVAVGGMPLVGFEPDNHAPWLDGGRGSVDANANRAILRVGYDGPDSRIPASVVPANNYSVEMWLRPMEKAKPVAYLIQRAAAGSQEALRGDSLAIGFSGGLDFIHDETPFADAENTVLTLGDWRHVAMVRDGTNVYVYLDGELDSACESVPLNDESAFDEGVWIFGARRDHEFLKLSGNLDEIAIYDRSLSGAEIQSHFSSALGLRKPNDPSKERISDRP